MTLIEYPLARKHPYYILAKTQFDCALDGNIEFEKRAKENTDPDEIDN